MSGTSVLTRPPGLDVTAAALEQSAAEILERMFFTVVEAAGEVAVVEGGPRAPETLAVDIAFHGAHNGSLRVVAPDRLAQELAANFNGIGDPREASRPQAIEVLRELTNMMCGATLSRLAPHAVFDLDQPTLAEGCPAPDPAAIARRLKSGSDPGRDWIELYWRWGETPTSGAEEEAS